MVNVCCLYARILIEARVCEADADANARGRTRWMYAVVVKAPVWYNVSKREKKKVSLRKSRFAAARAWDVRVVTV